MGLPLAHSVIAAEGGTLECHDSELGGALLRMRIPQAFTKKTLSNEGIVPEYTTAILDIPKRILVIDDQKQICKAIVRILHSHDVHTAYNGAQGLQKALENRYDLIICDVLMPVMGGIDVFEALRQADPTIRYRFMFITAGMFTPDIEQIMQSHNVPFLLKPFGARQLTDKIINVLGMHQNDSG